MADGTNDRQPGTEGRVDWRGALPRPSAREAWSRWAAGVGLSNPLFDRAALTLLGRLYFPASRMWAAAELAGCDPTRFAAEVAIPDRVEQRAAIAEALSRVAAARVAAEAMETRWREAFFSRTSAADIGPAELAAIESARLTLRHDYNAQRAAFLRYVRRSSPRVRLDTATPEAARERFPATAAASRFAAPDPMPEVIASRRFMAPTGPDYWFEFDSPSPIGDRVSARVHEPTGVTDPPTLIYGHGICVEFDHWQGLIDETPALLARGIRVVRPEAPWHGRRAPRGRFGGEHILGRFPFGILEAMTAAVREWAVITDWARRTSGGPVAFAGVSLGALTAQLAATRALDWPERLRPDALYLVTHAARVSDAFLGDAIHSMFGGIDVARAAGWTEDLAREIVSILDPGERPPLPAQRIVSVLGRRDIVTPYESGREQVERWCLPADNAFVLDRGHFSVPMSLVRDTRPVDRLATILKGA